MKERLKTFLKRVHSRLPSRTSVKKYTKKALKILLVSLIVSLGLYLSHTWAFEEGRRLGQCEIGCWTWGSSLQEIRDGNCVCAGTDGKHFLRIP